MFKKESDPFINSGRFNNPNKDLPKSAYDKFGFEQWQSSRHSVPVFVPFSKLKEEESQNS